MALIATEHLVFFLLAISNITTLDYFQVKLENFPIKKLNYVFCIRPLMNYSMLFVLIVSAVNVRLEAINEALLRNQMSEESVRCAMILHDKLCDNVKIVNRCFVSHIINFFFGCVFAFLFVGFSLYDMSINDVSFEKLLIGFTGLAYAVSEGFILMLILSTASSIKEKSRRVSNSLNKIAKTTSSKSIFIAALQLSHRSPIMSTAMYNIDFAVLMLIISSVFSNLIILIQFDKVV